MEDSIFTKIVKGEIPCHKIYEDEKTLAFLDINPLTIGHTLVIPKKQIEFVWDLDSEIYDALMITTKKIALHLRDNLKTKYISSRVVGDEVPHAHIHLIPFDTVSELKGEHDRTIEPDHASLSELAKKLSF